MSDSSDDIMMVLASVAVVVSVVACLSWLVFRILQVRSRPVGEPSHNTVEEEPDLTVLRMTSGGVTKIGSFRPSGEEDADPEWSPDDGPRSVDDGPILSLADRPSLGKHFTALQLNSVTTKREVQENFKRFSDRAKLDKDKERTKRLKHAFDTIREAFGPVWYGMIQPVSALPNCPDEPETLSKYYDILGATEPTDLREIDERYYILTRDGRKDRLPMYRFRQVDEAYRKLRAHLVQRAGLPVDAEVPVDAEDSFPSARAGDSVQVKPLLRSRMSRQWIDESSRHYFGDLRECFEVFGLSEVSTKQELDRMRQELLQEYSVDKHVGREDLAEQRRLEVTEAYTSICEAFSFDSAEVPCPCFPSDWHGADAAEAEGKTCDPGGWERLRHARRLSMELDHPAAHSPCHRRHSCPDASTWTDTSRKSSKAGISAWSPSPSSPSNTDESVRAIRLESKHSRGLSKSSFVSRASTRSTSDI